MSSKVSRKICCWLSNNKTIEISDYDLYVYAINSLLFGLAPIFIALILGVLSNSTKEAIIMIIPFMLIRKFSGGYHLKRPGTCLIISTMLVAIALWLINFITASDSGSVLTIFVIISCLITFMFSPIDSESRPLNKSEKIFFGKIAKFLTLIFFIIYVLLCLFAATNISSSIGVGIVLVAFLQLPCIIKKDISVVPGKKSSNK